MLGVNRHDQVTSGVGSFENTEGGRNNTNFLRYGLVAEADYPKGLIRVDIQDGEINTAWIPWLTQRSGNDRFWWAPEVGERVLVLAPSGDLHNAVAMTAQISNEFPQLADRETVQRTEFADGTTMEYDRDAHRLKWDVKGDIVIKAEGDVTIDAQGNVTIKGARIDWNP